MLYIYLYPYKIQIFSPDISNYIKYKFHFNFKEMQNLIKIGGDKIKLGNIFNEDLEDIINGKCFKEINEGFTNNRIVNDICKKCNYRKIFDK